MSNRERCLKLLDSFSDEQLADVAVMLESAKSMADSAADDAFCMRLYADYQDKADKDDGMPLEDFAKELGIAL